MLNSKLICDFCNCLKFVPSVKHPHNAKLKCPSCGNAFVYHKNIHLKQARYPNFDKDNTYTHGID